MPELDKRYDPKAVDAKWYKFWEGKGFFDADLESDRDPYCIVMPPPNVTGVLHMGHALVSTVQDILIRWKRMSGFEALWIPGCDHAGIATQTVVERHLIETEGKRRKDYSREEFLRHVWEWKEEKEESIKDQFRALGLSCDWSHYRFSMDEKASRAVRTMFKKLFDEGLIYRGDYLVNWDPVTQTALADDEVEHIERDTFLWHIRYPLADGSGEVVLATTRPETMLGDTAVAVHPEDERYMSIVGKRVLLPLTDREIPIVADHMVEREFGTGVVKITPAHDPNDNQLAERHDLPLINLMTPDGRMNENGGAYAGMPMEEAREAVAQELEKQGFLVKKEKHTHRVGISYRSKAVIEPYMSKQWFVNTQGFKKKLREAVEEKRVRLIPESWEHTYFHWIDNLRDWCISRQLWWGHRIPIWYNKADPEKMICWDGTGEAPNPDEWEQDPDALDTWFSSGLWPFSTLGWPDETPQLAKFYPNAVLVTGHDILFFWVARMIMMGEYALGKVPFADAFLHGLIYGRSYWRDDPSGGITYVSEKERRAYDHGEPLPKDVRSKWEKLSKSKGNVIDPYEVIDEYGTDAMRMALCASGPQNMQIDLDRRRFEEFRNFTNKIWNGARFAYLNLDDLTAEEFARGLAIDALTLEDKWLLSVLNRTAKTVHDHLTTYAFDHAALAAYDFFWKEFCAYYVEVAKPVLFGKSGTKEQRRNKQKLLVIALCQALRLLHPMAPFITEELFSALQQHLVGLTRPQRADPYTRECVEALLSPACIVAPYPTPIADKDINPRIEAAFELMQKVIYTIRNIRGEMNLPPGVETDLLFVGTAASTTLQTIQENQHLLPALLKTRDIAFHSTEPELPFASSSVVVDVRILVPLPPEMREQEKIRLKKQRAKLDQQIAGIKGRLANSDFTDKAPEALVLKTKGMLSQAEKELTEITSKLSHLS
jgi:valyl-tRNA synthetase